MTNLINFVCKYCDRKWKMVPRLDMPAGAQMEGICPTCFEEYQFQSGRFTTEVERIHLRRIQSKLPQ